MLSESEGEGEAGRSMGVVVCGESIVKLEKSTSDPEREALLRCRRRVSRVEGGLEVSLDRKPSPEDKMEMLDDFVRFGR